MAGPNLPLCLDENNRPVRKQLSSADLSDGPFTGGSGGSSFHFTVRDGSVATIALVSSGTKIPFTSRYGTSTPLSL